MMMRADIYTRLRWVLQDSEPDPIYRYDTVIVCPKRHWNHVKDQLIESHKYEASTSNELDEPTSMDMEVSSIWNFTPLDEPEGLTSTDKKFFPSWNFEEELEETKTRCYTYGMFIETNESDSDEDYLPTGLFELHNTHICTVEVISWFILYWRSLKNSVVWYPRDSRSLSLAQAGQNKLKCLFVAAASHPVHLCSGS